MDLPVDGRGARGDADSPESTIPELKPGVIVGGATNTRLANRTSTRRGRPCSLTLSLCFPTHSAVPKQATSEFFLDPLAHDTTDKFSPTMTAPAEPPRYVYKIVDTEPPFPIPDVFPPSELDKKDGFIHLSAPWQVSQASQHIKTSTSASTSATATMQAMHFCPSSALGHQRSLDSPARPALRPILCDSRILHSLTVNISSPSRQTSSSAATPPSGY